MAERSVLLVIFVLSNGIDNGGASTKTQHLSLSPWYCHRLVPLFINSAGTPCSYPCLFVSAHEHPHIVVQPEPDGTPCRITTGKNQGFKERTSLRNVLEGKCEGSVCRIASPHDTLKRKKRFICLYSIVKLIKEKRKLKKLREDVSRLQNGAALGSSGAVGTLSGRHIDTRRLSGSGPGGNGGSTIVRILIGPDAGNGVPRDTPNSAGLGESGRRSVVNSGGSIPYSLRPQGMYGEPTQPTFSAGYRVRSPFFDVSRTRRSGFGITDNGGPAVNSNPGLGNRFGRGGNIGGRFPGIGRSVLGTSGAGSTSSPYALSDGMGSGRRENGAASIDISSGPSPGSFISPPTVVDAARAASSAVSRLSGSAHIGARNNAGRDLSNENRRFPPVSNSIGGTSYGSGGNRPNDGTRIENGGAINEPSSGPGRSLFEVDTA